MIVQCATFSKILNPRNIDKTVSDIRIRIRFPFESSFWISVSGCKLIILPDIQPANWIVISSATYPIYKDNTHTIPTSTPMVQKLLLGLAVECTSHNPGTKRPLG